MADVITDTEQVNAVIKGFTAWMPVISTLAGGVLAGGVALLVSRVNHRYAREREATTAAERLRHEQQLAEDKQQKELLYITTELVFHLERFAEHCVRVATDAGYEDSGGVTRFSEIPEDLSLTTISGDWRVLPRQLMYRVRELPVLQNGADRAVSSAAEHDDPPDYSDTYYERRYQYAWLGLKTIILSRRLRNLAQLPATRLDATPWSAQPTLWTIWRQERKRRANISVLNKRAMAAFQFTHQVCNHDRHDEPAGPEDGAAIPR